MKSVYTPRTHTAHTRTHAHTTMPARRNSREALRLLSLSLPPSLPLLGHTEGDSQQFVFRFTPARDTEPPDSGIALFIRHAACPARSFTIRHYRLSQNDRLSVVRRFNSPGGTSLTGRRDSRTASQISARHRINLSSAAPAESLIIRD